MTLVFDFIAGAGIAIEFPGDGIKCVLTLAILRVFFLSNEKAEEWSKE